MGMGSGKGRMRVEKQIAVSDNRINTFATVNPIFQLEHLFRTLESISCSPPSPAPVLSVQLAYKRTL